MLEAVGRGEVTFRNAKTRSHCLADAAASTAAVLVVTLASSDMVASTHGFRVPSNVTRTASSCERVCKG